MADPISIDLPFPISVNRLWRVVGRRVIKSSQYSEWIKEAHKELMRTGGHKRQINGRFRYRVVLDETKRKPSHDGDNFSSKAILDLLQQVEVIENDNLAESGSWEWGNAPAGCRVELISYGEIK